MYLLYTKRKTEASQFPSEDPHPTSIFHMLTKSINQELRILVVKLFVQPVRPN